MAAHRHRRAPPLRVGRHTGGPTESEQGQAPKCVREHVRGALADGDGHGPVHFTGLMFILVTRTTADADRNTRSRRAAADPVTRPRRRGFCRPFRSVLYELSGSIALIVLCLIVVLVTTFLT
jgi:hypothetical protein